MMIEKTLLLILFITTINCLSLTHDQALANCFYRPLGDIASTSEFTYTITNQWTDSQIPDLKSGKLNTSDFIHVNGWTPYDPQSPFIFFTKMGKKGFKDIQKLKPIRSVLHGSDAPEFGLDDPSLYLAFGNPSTAKVYEVPIGKVAILMRFQSKVSGTPYIGRWSVLLDIVNENQVAHAFNEFGIQFDRLSKKHHLTPLEVTRALNIIPPFKENSIFWSLLDQTHLPAVGSRQKIIDTAFIEQLPAKQQFLAGFIADGQQDIIQVKDNYPSANRTHCSK